MRIAQTARKHEVRDSDILHALRNPLAKWWLDADLAMRDGPARVGKLLEIGVVGINSDDPVIVHAMPCRSQFLPR